MTEARRLAAILATDLVGYSRLMGEDEAGTARAVAIATSSVTIFNDRFTSRAAVAAALRRRGGPSRTHAGSDQGRRSAALSSFRFSVRRKNPAVTLYEIV